ncbi:MAG: methyltransferase domain-containing protein [Bacteroidota bacterium]
MDRRLGILWQIIWLTLFISCQSVNKPYNYKRFPDSYLEIKQEYNSYYHLTNCQPGETIASIGAGNGITEIQISCFEEGITWYLQEIDSSRLYQFEAVLRYHKNVVDSSINADFNLVLGTEDSTHLPNGIFDRVLMLNVFHEIELREGIMMEIHRLLNENGVLVIMERMGKVEGEIHRDCKHPKLVEGSFLREMNEYGYALNEKQLGEEMSNLMFYSFVSRK